MESRDKFFEEWTYDKFASVAQNFVVLAEQTKALSEICQMYQDQIIALKKRIIALETRERP